MIVLPTRLRVALDARLQGVSRRELAARASAMSERYRAGGGSDGAVRDDMEALAYAVARMPATYAATEAALRALVQRWPTFAPQTTLDLGAGPGSATYAALETWPTIGDVRQYERNAAMRSLAADLAAAATPHVTIDHTTADFDRARLDIRPADLVIATYLLVELAPHVAERVIARAFESCSGALVLVEPGTPAGFGAIAKARTQLIGAGARVIAPCPGEMACPMSGTDWCHFSVRLARSRDHMLLKGAQVPFEDERFSFVAVSRSTEPRPAAARILAEPVVERAGITLKLCTIEGMQHRVVPRRDKAAYTIARRLGWGSEAAE